jgi:hypothetical protein
MLVEFKSNESQRKMKKQLTEAEWKAVNDAINVFEDINPRRKKLLIDMDFIIPLIHLLRED